MRYHSFSYVTLAIGLASALPAQAFTVQRAGNAVLAAAAPSHANAAVAPFDDDPGSLSDGENYFYLVKNAAGARVQLSVQKNFVLDAVRLGFDDGVPASANVNVVTSGVTLEPASIPADGASMAIVTVVPVDPLGVALGSGLSIALDANALLPGVAAAPVVDHQDGSYSFAVLSTQPGSGNVVVSVEGKTLLSQPTVTYTLVGPSVCGDGFVDTSNFESCDDGNAADDDACPGGCRTAYCGDGFVWAGVEQCDGGPSCNANCTASTCGAGGSLTGCTAANALLVIIGQFQVAINGNPTSPLAAELRVIVDHLENAHDALTHQPPNPTQAKADINLAIGHLDEAVAAGLSTPTAWWRALQLLWIAGRI